MRRKKITKWISYAKFAYMVHDGIQRYDLDDVMKPTRLFVDKVKTLL